MKTAAAARQQQSRVLVVEDERDVADLIRYNLTKEGYDVVVAPTGSDALKQVREVHPDLVLLDIMVPQLNGWEVCRRLKQDVDTKNIRSRRASCSPASAPWRAAAVPATARRSRTSRSATWRSIAIASRSA